MRPATLLILCASLTLSSAARAQQYTCSPPETDPPHLALAQVEGDVLTITIQWAADTRPGSWATILVLDRYGKKVSSLAVQATPRTNKRYELTRSRDFFAKHGYRYTVEVVDQDGRPLVPAMPVLVTLCPRGMGCTYSTVGGIETDTVTLSGKLLAVLDSLAARRSKDLLHDALAEHPDLASQIYWFADQLGHTAKAQARCSCSWLATYNMSSTQANDSHFGAGLPAFPDQEARLISGHGPNSHLAGQSCGENQLALADHGFAELGLHLRCFASTSGTTESWAGLEIQVPDLRPCEQQCPDAAVGFYAFAWSRAAASAWATANQTATSYAKTSANLYYGPGSAPVLTTTALLDLGRPPGDPDQEFEEASRSDSAHWTELTQDARITLEVDTDVELCLGGCTPATATSDCAEEEIWSSDYPWAYGCAITTTHTTLSGAASCAAQPGRVSLHAVRLLPAPGDGTEDGLVIVPWHP